VVASFQLRLDPGASPEAGARASEEAISAMRERMQHSPVPRNRPAAVPLTLNIASCGSWMMPCPPHRHQRLEWPEH